VVPPGEWKCSVLWLNTFLPLTGVVTRLTGYTVTPITVVHVASRHEASSINSGSAHFASYHKTAVACDMLLIWAIFALAHTPIWFLHHLLLYEGFVLFIDSRLPPVGHSGVETNHTQWYGWNVIRDPVIFRLTQLVCYIKAW